jgi:hypothetical protein
MTLGALIFFSVILVLAANRFEEFWLPAGAPSQSGHKEASSEGPRPA